MAAAQRLLTKQLLLVGRCSLCRQLHTALDQVPSSRTITNTPLSHFAGFHDRASGGTRNRTFARAAQEERRTDRPATRNDRYQARSHEGGSVSIDESDGMRTGSGARDYDGEGTSKAFRGWGSFSKPNTWGTKNKKVWKSKQAPSEDDPETRDELYPSRESVRKGRSFGQSDERRQSAYRDAGERVSSSEGPVRRKASGSADYSPGSVGTSGRGEREFRRKESRVSEASVKGFGRDFEVGRESRQRTAGGATRLGEVGADSEGEVERKSFGGSNGRLKSGVGKGEVRRTKFGRSDGSDSGETGSASAGEDEVQRKVFGVSDAAANEGNHSGSRYSERNGASGSWNTSGDVSERSLRTLDGALRSSVGAPKKKDAIKKAYKRPGSIHTEEDQQPWVRGQARGEVAPQVYSGLRKRVTESDGTEEEESLEPVEPSAARDLRWGQEIDFKVYQFTPLGMRVIIRGGYEGLVYTEQIDLYGRERIEVGDVMKGYVGKVREDDKVDVSLRPFGFAQYQAGKAYLEEQLIIYGGFIPLTSKSSPEEIAAKLQLTKSGFKKAVGGLMKIGRAMETEEGIVLIDESGEMANDRQ